MYAYAVDLIKAGKAYVDDLSAEEIRSRRGTLTKPGSESPYRGRSIEENLDLFQRMRAGDFPNGAKVLRAKIDMAHPNMNLRDPIMYRILHAAHHRTAEEWCIYPTYDWAHGLEDSIEHITHSICTLEFENHRPLYDWFLEQLDVFHSQQIEFARLNLTYTVMSKRMLRKLVDDGIVCGWDDPRLPTIRGMRRRGYPPAALHSFCRQIGVSKNQSSIPMEFLEHCVRDELNVTSQRFMAVLRPLKVVLENYPRDQTEDFAVENNPEDPAAGARPVSFGKELYIETSDFQEQPPKKFYRLAPGREVRLKNTYFITCQEVIKVAGRVVELRCTIDPATRGGRAPDGRRPKSTLHWVSAAHACDAEIRLYDRLFTVEDPAGQEQDFTDFINPTSLEVLSSCKVEPAVTTLKPYDRCQFLRHGYFCVDPQSSDQHLILNRTVSLRDTWAKIRQQQK
jgi:glutaminyl-tRNA synthetase